MYTIISKTDDYFVVQKIIKDIVTAEHKVDLANIFCSCKKFKYKKKRGRKIPYRCHHLIMCDGVKEVKGLYFNEVK